MFNLLQNMRELLENSYAFKSISSVVNRLREQIKIKKYTSPKFLYLLTIKYMFTVIFSIAVIIASIKLSLVISVFVPKLLFFLLSGTLNKCPILPELFLLSSVLCLLVYGLLRQKTQYNHLLVSKFTYLSIWILVITFTLVWLNSFLGSRLLYENLLVVDFPSCWTKLFCLAVSIVCLVMGKDSLDKSRLACFEFFILYLFSILGIMFFISSIDLFTMFLSIEIQSICLYGLVALNKGSGYGSEAGIKFFILGAFSSGILIYGISLIYGSIGSTNLFNLYSVLLTIKPEISFMTLPSDCLASSFCFNLKLILGILLLLVGLLFKITAVPFHMWAPDVYEGAPITVIIFLATVPKIAVFYYIAKLTGYFLISVPYLWEPLLISSGILSVIIGTLMAVRQYKVKRFIAYSSITHMGYILLCLSSGTFNGLTFSLIYLVVYIFTILNMWGILLVIENNYGHKLESLSDWGGIFHTNKTLGFHLGVTLFSLGGLPPFAGFFSKYLLLKSMLNSDMYIIVLLLIIFSLISIYYYVNIIKIVFFDSKAKFPVIKEKVNSGLTSIMSLFLFFILFFFGIETIWPFTHEFFSNFYYFNYAYGDPSSSAFEFWHMEGPSLVDCDKVVNFDDSPK